jgi:hypothetical protein
MTPLDLTKQPPRPCRAELDGIIYLPRAIDKIRGAMPGGNIGAYFNLHPEVNTLSGLFYRRMRITHEEFAEAVASAETDADVVAWLQARIDDTSVEKFTRQLLDIKLGALSESDRAAVQQYQPASGNASDDSLIIDLLDADDVAVFARGDAVAAFR